MSPIIRKVIAETFGTYCLVFAGTGAIVINDIHGSVSHVGIALTFGLIVTAMIYSVGEISGAHINPAVTIGFWIARRFEGRHVIPYIGGQLVGALLASMTLRALFWEHEGLGGTLPAGSWQQSFVLEFLLTAILMFVILQVSQGSQSTRAMAGVAIGATVGLEAMFAGPVCGASMNPARSIAPALVSLNLEHLWLYCIATTLGAVSAVGISHVLKPVSNRAERVDVDTDS